MTMNREKVPECHIKLKMFIGIFERDVPQVVNRFQFLCDISWPATLGVLKSTNLNVSSSSPSHDLISQLVVDVSSVMTKLFLVLPGLTSFLGKPVSAVGAVSPFLHRL